MPVVHMKKAIEDITKNPKNNITIIQMYDEDNYSYKTA